MFGMLSLFSLNHVINEMNKVEKKKMINIESYQKGFMDGVDCKDNYKIRLLGYDLTELLKIVDDYATRKPKMPTKARMTRAEAIACLDKHNPHNYNTSHIDWAKTQELIVKELNMNLTKSRGRGKEVHTASAMAGHKAGGSARFDKPVGQGGVLRLK